MNTEEPRLGKIIFILPKCALLNKKTARVYESTQESAGFVLVRPITAEYRVSAVTAGCRAWAIVRDG
jgi:hypothetical protein